LPDATGLELLAQDVREALGPGAVVSTRYAHERASIDVSPGQVREALEYLTQSAREPWNRLMSVHGCDYLPDEPRFGVHYELLSTERLERLNVRTRVTVDDPHVPSVVDLFPTADFQEKEIYDMFGVIFEGHPGLRRILMPEDYEGHPQRRDFPIGGEPVLFTWNSDEVPRWYE